jgi:hypothetical protein
MTKNDGPLPALLVETRTWGTHSCIWARSSRPFLRTSRLRDSPTALLPMTWVMLMRSPSLRVCVCVSVSVCVVCMCVCVMGV